MRLTSQVKARGSTPSCACDSASAGSPVLSLCGQAVRLRGCSSAQLREQIPLLLEGVKLSDVKDKRAGTFSTPYESTSISESTTHAPHIPIPALLF